MRSLHVCNVWQAESFAVKLAFALPVLRSYPRQDGSVLSSLGEWGESGENYEGIIGELLERGIQKRRSAVFARHSELRRPQGDRRSLLMPGGK
jgi:hypothetical protein